jgi:hypothetical protein
MQKSLTSKWILIVLAAFFVSTVTIIPQISYCQTATPSSTSTIGPTAKPTQPITSNLLVIGGIIAAIAVAIVVTAFFVARRRVSEKSLKKFSATAFQDWVITRFNGKPSDPSLGVDGFTEGGQPLSIKQSENVTLAEVENFVKILANGKSQNGTVVAFNFDNEAVEGRAIAMDNGIDLQMLRINELLNKRYTDKIKNIARLQVNFEAPLVYQNPPVYQPQTQTQPTQIESFEKTPNDQPNEGPARPRVFISNSNTKVADQVKRMLDFLHYDYIMGDKEETTVPISDGKFGIMKGCDCAIINIAAAEQERRYSGLYILNSNVTSEINAAYLNYNAQVILLVERKVDLPPNLKGLKRIEYNTDDLSFDAAMDLDKILADFKRI